MSTMTRLPGVPDTDDVKPGMAHYAGSGPIGKTCETCEHRGYYRPRERFNKRLQQWEQSSTSTGGCAKYRALTGRHGPTVQKAWRACKYYEEATR